MPKHDKQLERRLDEVLERNDLDTAAAVLALGDLDDESTDAAKLDFCEIREQLPIRRQNRRKRWRRWWFSPLVFSLSAAVVLLALRLGRDPSSPGMVSYDAGQRLKGGAVVSPCGEMRLRVHEWTQNGPAMLDVRQINIDQRVLISVSVAADCWGSVYLVGLEDSWFKPLSEPVRYTRQTDTPISSSGHLMARPGHFVIVGIGTNNNHYLARGDVIPLLRKLGKGETLAIQDQPVSIDVFEIEVK